MPSSTDDVRPGPVADELVVDADIAGESAATIAMFDDPRIEAFGMVVEAHNELTNAVTRGLSEHGDLAIPWIGVLIRLARSPGQRLRMSALASDMTMSNSGLTRLVDRIEGAGHVRREACAGDRRGLFAVLPPAGLDVVADTAPQHLDDLQRLLAAPLSAAELVTLTDLLRRVRDHIRALDT